MRTIYHIIPNDNYQYDKMHNELGKRLKSTYLPCCGPTLLLSNEELAVMSSSFIAPDSIPNGAIHCAETEK